MIDAIREAAERLQRKLGTSSGAIVILVDRADLEAIVVAFAALAALDDKPKTTVPVAKARKKPA